jgi:hypothetical protein
MLEFQELLMRFIPTLQYSNTPQMQRKSFQGDASPSSGYAPLNGSDEPVYAYDEVFEGFFCTTSRRFVL